MREDELLTGDIIFFKDVNGIPQHVAIYSGKRAGTHFISHAVSDPYQCIITTRLKPDDHPYRVYRPKEMALGAQAAHRMRIWGKHHVPFSKEKHHLHEIVCDMPKNSHPKTGGIEQVALAQKYFARNFYRYIEFASHPKMPYFPQGEKTEGMYCSEALTAAFNVEKLLTLNAVRSYKDLDSTWISDHFQMSSALEGFEKYHPSTRYRSYLDRLHSGKEYDFTDWKAPSPQIEAKFMPSIVAWRYDKYGRIESFVDEYKEFPLPLDCKVTTPWAMMTYFEQHPECWLDMGTLTVAKRDYPLEKLEANKKEWREYVKELFKKGDEKHENIRHGFLNRSMEVDKIPSPTKPKIKRRFSVGDLQEVLRSSDDEIQEIALGEQMSKVLVFTTPPKPKKPSPRSEDHKPSCAKTLNFDWETEKSSFKAHT